MAGLLVSLPLLVVDLFENDEVCWWFALGLAGSSVLQPWTCLGSPKTSLITLD